MLIMIFVGFNQKSFSIEFVIGFSKFKHQQLEDLLKIHGGSTGQEMKFLKIILTVIAQGPVSVKNYLNYYIYLFIFLYT